MLPPTEPPSSGPSGVLKNSIRLPVMSKYTIWLTLDSSLPCPQTTVTQLLTPGWSSSYSFSALTSDTGPHTPGVQAPDRLPTQLSVSWEVFLTPHWSHNTSLRKISSGTSKQVRPKSLCLALQALQSHTPTHTASPLSPTPFQI